MKPFRCLLVLLTFAASDFGLGGAESSELRDRYRASPDVVVARVVRIARPKLSVEPGPLVELSVERVLKGSFRRGWELTLRWTCAQHLSEDCTCQTLPALGSRWLMAVHLAAPNAPIGSPSWEDVAACRRPATGPNLAQVRAWLGNP
ncbi:MAG: hypothetical protein U0931_02515 [Vulcanimicrobiota bacterium]